MFIQSTHDCYRVHTLQIYFIFLTCIVKFFWRISRWDRAMMPWACRVWKFALLKCVNILYNSYLWLSLSHYFGYMTRFYFVRVSGGRLNENKNRIRKKNYLLACLPVGRFYVFTQKVRLNLLRPICLSSKWGGC